MQKEIGEEFNKIINSNVLNEIAYAMNSLGAELLYTDKENAQQIIEQYSKIAKRIITSYIDEQATILVKIRDDS